MEQILVPIFPPPIAGMVKVFCQGPEQVEITTVLITYKTFYKKVNELLKVHKNIKQHILGDGWNKY